MKINKIEERDRSLIKQMNAYYLFELWKIFFEDNEI